MKSLYLFVFIVSVAYAARSCAVGIPEATGGKKVAFSDLVTNPTQFDNQVVSFQANVRSIVDKIAFNKLEVGVSGVPATVTVAAENNMFTFPLDSLECEASVLGVFHNIDESLRVFRVDAVRVGLAAPSSAQVCEIWPRDVRTQNMTQDPELETDYMGTGYVILQPNEQMHRHSTNMSSEIVTVVEGSVVFVIFRNSEVPEKHELKAPAAIFVPHSTMHMVLNPFKTRAVYIYTHAMVPVVPQEMKHGHHMHHMPRMNHRFHHHHH